MTSDLVKHKALELAAAGAGLPAYIYDLSELRTHAEAVRDALAGSSTEFFYAAKANPEPELLKALEPFVHGFEVASGGELAHVRNVLPDARIAFGGPGKTDHELRQALELGAERLHVESPHELTRLLKISDGADVQILLRANLDLTIADAVLSMSGPFGMDEDAMLECLDIAKGAPGLTIRGIHTHLASGLGAEAMLQLADQITGWALPWFASNLPDVERPELVLGGGMAVDYTAPDTRFNWSRYGAGLVHRAWAELDDEVQLRIEPGRAITVYCGYYVTDVLDVKWTRGKAFAVLRGGTHHIRTPATKGHSQPFTVIHRNGDGPKISSDSATLVGQLCTPKDMLAQGAVDDLRVGDLVAFSMAGAYAWNISHHDFLMHPKPSFHYLNEPA
jgi:diaminopimelate decarboxylase